MRQSTAKPLTTDSTVFSKFQITDQLKLVLNGLKANILTSSIIMSSKVVIARIISWVHMNAPTRESPLHCENVTFRPTKLHAIRLLDEKV